MKNSVKKISRNEIRHKLLEEYAIQLEKKILREQKKALLIEKNVRKIERFCSVSERTCLKEGIRNRKVINENILSDLFGSVMGGSTDATKQSIATWLISKVFGESASKGLLGVIVANFADNLTMDAISKITSGNRVCETITDIVVQSILEALNEEYVIKLLLGDSTEEGNIVMTSLARTLREMLANATNNTSFVQGLRTTISGFICNMSFFGGKSKGSLPDFGSNSAELQPAKFM